VASGATIAGIFYRTGGSGMNIVINTSHPRVIKARYRKVFLNAYLRKALAVISVISAVMATVLVVLDNRFGWLVFIIPTVLLMLHEWYRHDLRDLPIGPADTLEDMLSADVLAVLPSKVTSTEECINVLKKTNDYWFLTNRLLLYPDIISTMATADNWLNTVKDIYNKYPLPVGITAAHILAGIVLSSQDKSKVLSYSQNSEQDVYDGLGWYKKSGHHKGQPRQKI
jgi:hypothetical protein